MLQKCTACNLSLAQTDMKVLDCAKHFMCTPCVSKKQATFCDQCQIIISQRSYHTQRALRNYPIQGIMVNHDKIFNPQGESQFSSRRNCYQRTNGWILCNFLAIVFFFSGLALAIKTAQKGTGAIMVVLGAIGIVASIYFICKVRKVDRHHESSDHLNQDNFIYIKNDRLQRRTISSAKTERN